MKTEGMVARMGTLARFANGLVLGVLVFLACVQVQAAPQSILPGEVWKDSDGNVIQAHGAGLIQVGKTFYWFGEDHTGQTSDQSFQNVKCYASRDLAHWTFRGNALSRAASGDLGPSRVVERPKVVYNRRTRMFVMYMHIDSRNYAEAKVGVATCKQVDGVYTYQSSFAPLGHQSRDETIFQDTDGVTYLLHEDRGSGVRIERLMPDYLSIDQQVALIPHALEGLAVVKVDGTYFLLGSNLTGWASNANQYATAPSMAGPWSTFINVAPDTNNTYDSQTAYILPIKGRKGISYIYIGDRWKGSNLQDSRYLWLPLTIHDHTMLLAPDKPWMIDVGSGIISEAH
ncbi:MAG: family 43 glycosylhydrolase [Armatimonadota bacterium]|nr:family 43 glycosylhydrolase [Armatimonadota bacterium]